LLYVFFAYRLFAKEKNATAGIIATQVLGMSQSLCGEMSPGPHHFDLLPQFQKSIFGVCFQKKLSLCHLDPMASSASVHVESPWSQLIKAASLY
jgi:hypothetical protein